MQNYTTLTEEWYSSGQKYCEKNYNDGKENTYYVENGTITGRIT